MPLWCLEHTETAIGHRNRKRTDYFAGRNFERIPRVVWNTISVVIYTVCAIAGRAALATIFTNFLALMGYWVCIWIAIVLEEHLIFRRYLGLGWDWEIWNDRHKLPLGIAALIAFLVGWAGAILCMAQVWYIGPSKCCC